MTWDELMETTRKELGEGAAHVRALNNMVAAMSEGNGDLSKGQIGIMAALLTLAISTLHSAVESISIGLDAIVEAVREANKSQGVSGE